MIVRSLKWQKKKQIYKLFFFVQACELVLYLYISLCAKIFQINGYIYVLLRREQIRRYMNQQSFLFSAFSLLYMHG